MFSCRMVNNQHELISPMSTNQSRVPVGLGASYYYAGWHVSGMYWVRYCGIWTMTSITTILPTHRVTTLDVPGDNLPHWKKSVASPQLTARVGRG